MATTTNNKLFKYTNDNDSGDLKLLADTMDTIDKGISLKYPATLTAENTYTVTTGLSKTSLYNDYSLKVKIPSSSSGAVKIIIDSCSAVPVMKATSSGLAAVKNFKAKGIYELVYEDGNFLCASGDNLEEVTVTSDKLLENETANDGEGNVVKGNISVKGKASATLTAGQSISYQPGYYSQSIDVSAKDLASQTQATADSTKILVGYNAIVNGQRIDGEIPNRGEYQYSNEVGAGSDYISFRKIPYGYYPQSSELFFPEIRANFNIIAPVIGLTADKIVAGNKLLGIDGNATVESLGGIPILYSVTMNGITNGYTFPYTTASDVNYVVIIMKDNTNNKVYITSRYTAFNYSSYFYSQTATSNDLSRSNYSIYGRMNSNDFRFSGSISSNVTITVIKFM